MTVTGLGEPWRTVVSAKASAAKAAAAGATPLVNAGQTGYFRSRYSPELESLVIASFPRLGGADQLGLIYDSQALGQAGYAPMSDFLAVALQAQGSAGPGRPARADAQQLDAAQRPLRGPAGRGRLPRLRPRPPSDGLRPPRLGRQARRAGQ